MHTSKNLKTHTLLSVLTILIGFVLLIYMIVVEDEPGAIPLILVVCGTGWLLYARFGTRPHHE